MGRLLDLPNELLQEVIHLVVPEGIEQISLCSRDIYHLAGDALDLHRRRKQQYSLVNCDTSQVYGEASVKTIHPLQFFVDIALREWIAYYTTELTIEDSTDDEDETIVTDAQLMRDSGVNESFFSDETKEWIFNKVASCPYLADDEINQWTENILSGIRGTTCALLITLLPNLRSMKIIASPYEDTPLTRIVGRIAEGKFQGRTSQMALGKLSEVDTNHSGCTTEFGMYAPWAALPSMRSLHGRMVKGHRFNWSYSPHTSGVTDIRYDYSSINAASFTELFKCIKALRSFTYEGGDYVNGNYVEWDPTGIVTGLILYAKGSLQKLDITYSKEQDPDDSGYFLISLAAFEDLRWVRLDVELLYKTNSDDWNVASTDEHSYETGLDDYHYAYEAQPLIDILPASIETLELVGVLSERNTASLMARLPELKQERVPRLEKIVFEGNCSLDEKMMTECKNVGIMLEHRNTSWYTRMNAMGLHHYY